MSATAAPTEHPRSELPREPLADLVRLTKPGQPDPERVLAEIHEWAARRLAALPRNRP